MEETYNKLVRDNVPDRFEKKGDIPVTRTLSDSEYRIELFRKLREECNATAKASNGIEMVQKLGDVLEVCFALAKLESKTPENLMAIASQKREVYGGYNEKTYLEKVIRRS